MLVQDDFTNAIDNSSMQILHPASAEGYEGGCSVPADMKVLANHIYEYQKGVRRMVLFTFNKRYEKDAVRRLKRFNIDYIIQAVGNDRLNLYFGRKECLDAVRLIVTKPLCELSPEEDFILGTLLGYDLCEECKRFCDMKCRRSDSRQKIC